MHTRCWWWLILLITGGQAVLPASADTGTTSAPVSNPTQAVAASAALDFKINMGKFLFFRVGTGAYPAASSVVDTVSFSANPSIPAAPVTGNSAAVSWNGSTPSFVSTASVTLPVEVRSNAGQVSIRATVSTPLSSGSSIIPMSDISIVSSSSFLPAPVVPASGTGAGVNVTGTAFSNLVTQRSATWTFSYAGVSAPAAGVYSGVITFTASAP